ncbi:unnamed protein product [Strongylus vulgaris]|uniref:Uncharacterized protein n=1 Tax=Strongylus vulgaris TaxID=40348 RepID=A0A3P7J396_STRVU|nr:unnamed protein product [Strongylus vulgaris]
MDLPAECEKEIAHVNDSDTESMRMHDCPKARKICKCRHHAPVPHWGMGDMRMPPPPSGRRRMPFPVGDVYTCRHWVWEI